MNALQAKGRAYENRCVRAITRALAAKPRGESALRTLAARKNKAILHPAQWIKFVDSAGQGNAQPDLYLHFTDRILVFEFKRTRCQAAEQQLLDLYGPLLHHIFHLPLVYISCFYNPGSDYEPLEGSPHSLEDCFNLSLWSFNEWHLRV